MNNFNKIFIVSFIALVYSIACNAQIFDSKVIRDKFDDVIYNTSVKSILDTEYYVYGSDTLFCVSIEEKGKAKKYYVLGDPEPSRERGLDDNSPCVQLCQDVYGKQYAFKALELSAYKKWATTGKVSEEAFFIFVHRMISTNRFYYEHSEDVIWLENCKGNRTIYYNK